MSLRFITRFAHYDAKTVQEATSLLSKYGDKGKPIAGGTALMDILKKKYLPTPEAIVNLKTIPGLDQVMEEGGALKIGALTKLTDLAESSIVKSKFPVIAETVKMISTPQLRNMGTVGGNLCQQVRCWYYNKPDFYCYRKGGPVCYQPGGDNRYGAIMEQKVCNAVIPSDLAVTFTALGATLKVEGPDGSRDVPIKDFYVTLGNILKPNEIVTWITIPEAPSKARFRKFKVRKSWDFAVASAAVATTSKGTVAALGGVAPVVVSGTPDEVSAALDKATPLSMNKYKIQIAKTMLKEAMA
ncbi:FAD binding domain-containing protein [Candidatus Bathyarchaeota archaeon]|nr:FAD binding domain-containing protein [Candidatus Bathyarchaeota archaeon]